MSKAIENIALPNDPAKQKELKIMLNEVLASLQRTDSEGEARGEIVDEIVRKFALPKKVVSKLIRTLHKHNFSDMKLEADMLESLYEIIVK